MSALFTVFKWVTLWFLAATMVMAFLWWLGFFDEKPGSKEPW